MHNFAGRVAIVTGAAGELGGAFANEAARRGMKLVLADADADGLERAAGALSKAGAEVLALVCEVSRAAHVEELADAAMARFRGVHLLFNNALARIDAGAGLPLWEAGSADWKRVLDVNLWGAVHGVRVFVPLMLACAAREAGYRGHIVNTASMAGIAPAHAPATGIDAIAGHAVAALSEALLRDLKTLGAPIGVSLMCADGDAGAAAALDAARRTFDAIGEDRVRVVPPAPDAFPR